MNIISLTKKLPIWKRLSTSVFFAKQFETSFAIAVFVNITSEGRTCELKFNYTFCLSCGINSHWCFKTFQSNISYDYIYMNLCILKIHVSKTNPQFLNCSLEIVHYYNTIDKNWRQYLNQLKRCYCFAWTRANDWSIWLTTIKLTAATSFKEANNHGTSLYVHPIDPKWVRIFYFRYRYNAEA